MSASANMGPRGNEQRGGDYGYANARVRGMRSRLLKGESLEHLMQAEDLHQLIHELMQTEYAADLEETLLRGRGSAEVIEALKRNLVRTYRKVFGFLNAEAYDICSVLLGRWDAFNLKTIVRGKHVHLSNEQIAEALLPVGALSETDLEGLLVQTDVRGVVATALTWGLPQAHALREGLSVFQDTHDLADLELAVDRHYAAWAAEALGKRNHNYQLARRILGLQVDTLNLVMVFRAAHENLDAEHAKRYFLEGGKDVDLELYQKLVTTSDVDEVLNALSRTRFSAALSDASTRYLETSSISAFERALEDLLARKAISAIATDALGVGVPISYLWSKQNEVTNVRIIVKSKEIGIPPERTRGELILV